MIVFVTDINGTPLLPTHPARARKLLNSGRAIVKQVVPFTIQLNKEVSDPVGEFEIGIDDGAKVVGIAIKNSCTNEIVFHGQLDHRLDVSRKVESRGNYRRARRFRLRRRPRRINNRNRKGKIAPSFRQRKEAIVRVIKDCRKRLNITKVIVEEVYCDVTDNRFGKFLTFVAVGKKLLARQIVSLGLEYASTRGYVTKTKRVSLGLAKRHSLDACAILDSNNIMGVEYFIKPRRTRVWTDNPKKTCEEKNGLRHYDLVTSIVSGRKVIGSVLSLCKARIRLRTTKKIGQPVGYTKTKLLQRFSGLIYSWTENTKNYKTKNGSQ